MVRSRVLTVIAVLALTAIGAGAVASAASADPPAPPGTPTATSFSGTATVGPIFRDGLSRDHECTASVIASPAGDLILTAHCLTGTAAGYQFVPGYRGGRAPYGVWTVNHVYLDPSWVKRQDPQHDYAILQVADHHDVSIEDVTGANLLGLAPRSGTTITDVAYNAGINDRPIRCTTAAYWAGPYPAFNCHGYVGGSSGSPWLSTLPGTHVRVVRGVIGGLHQGGCYEYTSYSSAFTGDVYRLLVRAIFRLHPDVAPEPGGDGC